MQLVLAISFHWWNLFRMRHTTLAMLFDIIFHASTIAFLLFWAEKKKWLLIRFLFLQCKLLTTLVLMRSLLCCYQIPQEETKKIKQKKPQLEKWAFQPLLLRCYLCPCFFSLNTKLRVDGVDIHHFDTIKKLLLLFTFLEAPACESILILFWEREKKRAQQKLGKQTPSKFFFISHLNGTTVWNESTYKLHLRAACTCPLYVSDTFHRFFFSVLKFTCILYLVAFFSSTSSATFL